VFIGSIPRTRSPIGGDNNQPGVERDSSSFDLNVERIAVQKLEKKGKREPRAVKVVENDNLLMFVAIPPLGVILVVSIRVDSRGKVGLSQPRGAVEDKNMSFEPSLGDCGKTIESRNSIVLGNNRKCFGIAPDVLDRNTGVEAFFKEKKISSFSLPRFFAKSPRTVDSRLLLGTICLSFFMSSTAQLPVSARINQLDRMKRLVGLETDVSLKVRSSFVTSLHLPDAVEPTPIPRILLRLGIVQCKHP